MIRDDAPVGDSADCWYVFHTADDERVCPECGPLDAMTVNGSWTWLHPPLHTNCRCWLELAWCEPASTADDEPFLPPPVPGPGTGGPF